MLTEEKGKRRKGEWGRGVRKLLGARGDNTF